MTPRPAILFTAAYWAGLSTGLLHFGAPLGVALTALVAGFVARPLGFLVGGGLLAGRLGGELAVALDREQCAARLPAQRLRVRVAVLEPVDSAGGRTTVTPLAACRGAVAARWPRGLPVGAGVRAEVVARWVPREGLGGRPGGTLVVGEARVVGASPGAGDRLRNGVYRASRRLYGTRAGIVDALILGRRGGIDLELQDRFARSGLVHLLSISGFHVGLITGWVFLLCRLAGMTRPTALVAAAAASAGYVVFLGWPAPAGRAAALAVMMARCRVRQRHVQANSLLAATCLAVLAADPWAALDLGGWLSAAALWGASTFTRWSDRAVGAGFLARTAASSLGATLATAPITAAFLGTVALAGLVLNFPAIPIAALAVPGVLASLVFLPVWAPAAEALAAGAGLGLHLLELCAVAGAAVPVGYMAMEPGSLRSTVPWILVLALSLWILGSRNTTREAARRFGWCVAAALWVGLAPAAAFGSADGGGGLTLHFLDVGQGDGAVLRTPGGRWLVIDAGPANERYDAGRRVLVPFLERQGTRALAAVVVSHAHADHMGGVPALLRRFPVGLVLEPGSPVAEPAYGALLAALDSMRIPWHPGRAGERFTIDGVRFTVLHPGPDWEEWGEDVNEDSLVILVEFGEFEALFTGDAGFPAEVALRRSLPQVDLLKVGHHGSRGSTGEELLDSLRPLAAVISVGRNDYGHPSPATLSRLEARRVPVLRTDEDGNISVTSDGRTMTIRTARGELTYPLDRGD
ncbi:MAG TPA: DNA internalization-related competence protein ComEC/Rec2 [Gemmatimonadales bacterium]|nr:DNA internalization-related competence protein ComEC/Rec2 [Gemmatimonadales bacterium]